MDNRAHFNREKISKNLSREKNAALNWLNDWHIQIYGWIDPGGNLSTSTVRGGNAPAAYGYNPNQIPMAYGEVFIPQVMDGLIIRFGRYISIPDIEAQLAPNNYMYSHSMTYTYDNHTNTGFEFAATKNWIFQLGRMRLHSTATPTWASRRTRTSRSSARRTSSSASEARTHLAPA